MAAANRVLPIARADVRAVTGLVRSAVAWLGRDGQPEGALLQHHGLHATDPIREWPAPLRMSLALPQPVVIFTIGGRILGDGLRARLFDQRGCDTLLAAVTSGLCHDGDPGPSGTWNGPGRESYSLRLAIAPSPDVARLVQTYHRGCQRTGDYLGEDRARYRHDTGSVFCNCDWYREGRALVHLPEGWS
jgi:hypothetical protein